jgi:hypothetical protein
MAAPYYLGDEISAAGYRLAGAQVAVPAPGEESAAFAAARAAAPLVLVSAAVAARIPGREMRGALTALSPLTLIVPDLAGIVAVPDVASRLRRQLGLEG